MNVKSEQFRTCFLASIQNARGRVEGIPELLGVLEKLDHRGRVKGIGHLVIFIK